MIQKNQKQKKSTMSVFKKRKNRNLKINQTQLFHKTKLNRITIKLQMSRLMLKMKHKQLKTKLTQMSIQQITLFQTIYLHKINSKQKKMINQMFKKMKQL